jgi:hypothetical protein
MKALVIAATLTIAAVPAAAQTADSRWDPFLGCWDLTVDAVRNNAPAAVPLAERPLQSRPRNEAGPRVCVTRTPEGAARFETTVRGQAAIDHTLVADGTSRPLNDAECRGTQQAEFSRDGLRLFSRAELTCQGDPGPRRVSGLSLLAVNGTWLDIQAVEIAGRETVRVRRYYRADGEAPIARATLSASSLSLDDVKEASGKVVPRALEAALVETNSGYFLSGKQLIDLDDAGVPDAVIDVIVALSYPERFVIERTARGGGGGGGTIFDNDPFGLGWAFGYPVWYDEFNYSPYYYSPFGYSRYGFGGYAYVDGIAVNPVDLEPQPTGSARAVDGQGYTRIRPRDNNPGNPDGPVTRGSSAFASSGGTSSTSSSGSSSGTASSGGGYSSGGSSSSSDGGGGDSGRTAQPR